MSALPHADLPIAAVEQATGIARATLRIWERRYGFPQPRRDERGERCYPEEQVHRLQRIAGLLLRGHRPGRLVQLTDLQLRALDEQHAGAAVGGTPAAVDAETELVALLRAHDGAGLAAHLGEALAAGGLEAFVTRRMPALNEAVGAGWARGELQVYEEHLYTEIVQHLLRQAIGALPQPAPGSRPRVLLATFPEEAHGLGLLMAQALLAAQGCHCTSLGPRVPVPQLVDAAVALHADVVGLSFSPALNGSQVLRGLEQLRGALAPRIAVWAGGSHPVLARRSLAGVRAVPHIDLLPQVLADWRTQQLAA